MSGKSPADGAGITTSLPNQGGIGCAVLPMANEDVGDGAGATTMRAPSVAGTKRAAAEEQPKTADVAKRNKKSKSEQRQQSKQRVFPGKEAFERMNFLYQVRLQPGCSL